MITSIGKNSILTIFHLFFLSAIFGCETLYAQTGKMGLENTEIATNKQITEIVIVNDEIIDPVTRIYKKISVDSIRRTENIQEPYCFENFIKEKKVLCIQEKFMPVDVSDINLTRFGLTVMAFRLGLLEEAISYGEIVSEQIGQDYEPGNSFGINLYAMLASAHQTLGHFDEAVKYYDKLLTFNLPAIFKAELYNDMAGLFLSKADIRNGEHYYQKAEETAREIDDQSLNYRLMLSKSFLLRSKGNYQNCIVISKELLTDWDRYKKDNSYNEYTRLSLLDNVMWCSHMLGNHSDAVEYGNLLQNCIDSLSVLSGTFVKARYLQNIAQVESSYYYNKRPDGFPDVPDGVMLNWLNLQKSPIRKQIAASEILRNLKGEKSNDFLLSLSALSGLYVSAGFFEEGLEIDKEIVEICNSNKSFDSKGFKMSALHLLLLSSILDSNSLELSKEDLITIADELLKVMTNNGADYNDGVFWSVLLDNYIQWQNIEKAQFCLSQWHEPLKKFISSNLQQIDDIQTMSNYWNTIESRLLDGIGYKGLWDNPENCGVFYDKALLYKSMKLSMLTNLTNQNMKERLLNVSWKDVRGNLNNGEGAIEILRVVNKYSGFESKNNMYIALAITKDSSCPSIMYLCSEEELTEFPVEERYKSATFTNLIYKPLLDWMDRNNLKTVYFSPMGEYSNIGLESLEIDSGDILSNKYEMIRLSSTRELIFRKFHQSNNINNLIAFGGINYDSSSKNGSNRKSAYRVTLNHLRDYLRGRNFEYLKGTANELDSISEICDKNKIRFIGYRWDDASENCFRLLKIGDQDILHIATHGFFLE